MTATRRIITNTFSTYVKLIVFALTGLFGIPIALKCLGAVDYGIFSVIGGCLAFLMFLNYSLQTGAQRHIAYALGRENSEEASKWFTTSLIVHLFVGSLIAGIALILSGWVLHRLLTLPATRLSAATWIYRMVVATMVCNVLATPYQALLIAHESIASMSLLNSLSGVLFLIAIFCLKYLPGDLLLWYGGIYCLFQVSVAFGPVCYCAYRYQESRFSSLTVDQLARRLRELLSFSGWSLLQIVSILGRVQGPAMVLNIFFGPIANAAYGLGVQAQSFASNIVWGLLGSATPQIVKRHASGDYPGMARLSSQTNTYGFAILWMALAPVLFEMSFCLKLWLRTPPPNTAAFLLPLLVALIVDQLTLGYNLSLVATGRMAGFSLAVAIGNLIGVPAGYLLLRAGHPGTWMLWAVVMGSSVAGCGRLWFARRHAGISIRKWMKDVLLPAILFMFASAATSLAIIHSVHAGIGRLLLVATVNCAVVCVTVWYFGTSKDQRTELKILTRSIPTRLFGKQLKDTRKIAEETLYQ